MGAENEDERCLGEELLVARGLDELCLAWLIADHVDLEGLQVARRRRTVDRLENALQLLRLDRA
jgi:hypothetical protein